MRETKERKCVRQRISVDGMCACQKIALLVGLMDLQDQDEEAVVVSSS